MNTESIASQFRSSRVAKAWAIIWKIFPTFSSRWSPFYFAHDGAALWNQGFGRVAYIRDNHVLMIGWGLGNGPSERRVFVSQIKTWEPPHSEEQLSDAEIQLVSKLLVEKYSGKGEKVVLQ
jgi:hypothetical protein